jgi:hypothetical protein
MTREGHGKALYRTARRGARINKGLARARGKKRKKENEPKVERIDQNQNDKHIPVRGDDGSKSSISICRKPDTRYGNF